MKLRNSIINTDTANNKNAEPTTHCRIFPPQLTDSVNQKIRHFQGTHIHKY